MPELIRFGQIWLLGTLGGSVSCMEWFFEKRVFICYFPPGMMFPTEEGTFQKPPASVASIAGSKAFCRMETSLVNTMCRWCTRLAFIMDPFSANQHRNCAWISSPWSSPCTLGMLIQLWNVKYYRFLHSGWLVVWGSRPQL